MKRSGGDYQISYHHLVAAKDRPRLDKVSANRIKRAIETKLITKPEIFGLPLRGTLKGYWKLRVGDWRIVYKISSNAVTVLIIAHRRDIYKLVTGRE